jgi:hypothetical protein
MGSLLNVIREAAVDSRTSEPVAFTRMTGFDGWRDWAVTIHFCPDFSLES